MSVCEVSTKIVILTKIMILHVIITTLLPLMCQELHNTLNIVQICNPIILTQELRLLCNKEVLLHVFHKYKHAVIHVLDTSWY